MSNDYHEQYRERKFLGSLREEWAKFKRDIASKTEEQRQLTTREKARKILEKSEQKGGK